MHTDYVTLTVVILGFIVTIGSNKLDLAKVENRLARIEADLREFYRVQGKHEGIIETLKEQRK